MCVVDISGHEPGAPTVGLLCARTAVRYGALYGARAGLTAAGRQVADPGQPTGAAVLAVLEEGEDTVLAWVGDAARYSWDGAVHALHARTTPQNTASYLTRNGDVDRTPLDTNWLTADLSTAVAATVAVAAVPAGQTLPVSDGVVDQAPHGVLEALVREHAAGEPQALASAIVGAATSTDGYRDDATAVIIVLGHG
ncbi:hypothetical protein [Streptomyces clavuligerus]|uniref:hypothetical protein n=1 Tax=Streptomyces clavuligerus TaxID=1901 RepID=UPI00018516F2|nr:hypothetical protein [Streptomyces clavuligerus]WDN56404.1 hypothetical protein LL058_31675 [Streptomyces clavuligerus]